MKIGKKISGGKYHKSRKKKLHERVGQKKVVKVGEERRKKKRIRGGEKRPFLFGVKFVNVKSLNEKGGNQKIEIKNVLETPSNRFLARQKVITKGTILETELGKVKITNRPSQEGMVNGILLK